MTASYGSVVWTPLCYDISFRLPQCQKDEGHVPVLAIQPAKRRTAAAPKNTIPDSAVIEKLVAPSSWISLTTAAA
jgi:hypothetical protein